MAKKIDTDKYQPIPGFPGYFISEDGEVIGKYGRPKKPQKTSNLCLMVNAQVDGKAKKINIPEAVLTVFGGPREGYAVLHLDGDQNNNHISNLQWTTIIERTAYDRRVEEIFTRPDYRLIQRTVVSPLASTFIIEENIEVYTHQPRPPKPGRTPKEPRPEGDAGNDLPKPDEFAKWRDYVRLLHQRLFQSNLDSGELKVLLVFISYALQEKKDPKRYLSEYEVGFLTKMERSPLARALAQLKKKGVLTEPPDLPERSFYYALNGRHMLFRPEKEDLLEVYGDDFEELHQFLIPDETLPAPKRAAIESVYVPAVLSEDTWLTVEQVAEICGVSVDYVNKQSSTAKLKMAKPTADVLRCLRMKGKGEKRFEWPEVDRWRHAIFFSPKVNQETNFKKYSHRSHDSQSSRKSSAHAYFSNQHWSKKNR